MSTKVKATVKSIGIGQNPLILDLTPYYHLLQEGDEVFVELQTMHGSRIEFMELSGKATTPEVQDAKNVSIGYEHGLDTIIQDTSEIVVCLPNDIPFTNTTSDLSGITSSIEEQLPDDLGSEPTNPVEKPKSSRKK